MSDLYLDDDGDLVLENGDLVLVEGQEEIKQHLTQRLRSYRGEWFLNLDSGVPYFQDILKKDPNPMTVDAALKLEILQCPGVIELTSFELTFDRAARTLSLSFSVDTIEGSIDFSNFELNP